MTTSTIVDGVRAGIPARSISWRTVADSTVESRAFPTPVQCSGTWAPTSVNIRIGCGEGTWAR